MLEKLFILGCIRFSITLGALQMHSAVRHLGNGVRR